MARSIVNSVGQAAPGIELKIADNGEVLVKGVSVLKEYYKRPTPPPRCWMKTATSKPAMRA